MSKSIGYKVLRIQRACTVSEQAFPSFAIYNADDDKTIRTSRLNEKKDYSLLAAIATVASLVGYITQFIGLRAMHWTSAISTLVGTLLMTAIRSLVRRGLAKDPPHEELLEDLELSWLAYKVMGLSRWELVCGSYSKNISILSHLETPAGNIHFEDDTIPEPGLGSIVPMTAEEISHFEHDTILGSASAPIVPKTVELRAYIQSLLQWEDSVRIVSTQLVTAIRQVMTIILTEGMDDMRKKRSLATPWHSIVRVDALFERANVSDAESETTQDADYVKPGTRKHARLLESEAKKRRDAVHKAARMFVEQGPPLTREDIVSSERRAPASSLAATDVSVGENSQRSLQYVKFGYKLPHINTIWPYGINLPRTETPLAEHH